MAHGGVNCSRMEEADNSHRLLTADGGGAARQGFRRWWPIRWRWGVISSF